MSLTPRVLVEVAAVWLMGGLGVALDLPAYVHGFAVQAVVFWVPCILLAVTAGVWHLARRR